MRVRPISSCWCDHFADFVIATHCRAVFDRPSPVLEVATFMRIAHGSHQRVIVCKASPAFVDCAEELVLREKAHASDRCRSLKIYRFDLYGWREENFISGARLRQVARTE
jgi:hypothetical protein